MAVPREFTEHCDAHLWVQDNVYLKWRGGEQGFAREIKVPMNDVNAIQAWFRMTRILGKETASLCLFRFMNSWMSPHWVGNQPSPLCIFRYMLRLGSSSI
jgi:hypothetical protein